MCTVLLPPGVNPMCTVLLPLGVNTMCTVLLPPGVNTMCTVLLPPGVNTIAVKNKQINKHVPLLVGEEQQMCSYPTYVPTPLTNPHALRRWKMRRLFIGLCVWLLTTLCQLKGHFEYASVVGCGAMQSSELLTDVSKSCRAFNYSLKEFKANS
jgi:hypothetical protein